MHLAACKFAVTSYMPMPIASFNKLSKDWGDQWSWIDGLSRWGSKGGLNGAQVRGTQNYLIVMIGNLQNKPSMIKKV